MEAILERLKGFGISDEDIQEYQAEVDKEADQKVQAATRIAEVAKQEAKEAKEEAKEAKEEAKEAKEEAKEAKEMAEQLLQFKSEVKKSSVLKYFEEGCELPGLAMLGDKSGPSTNRKHKPIDTKITKNFGVIDIPHKDVEHCATRTTEIFSAGGLRASTENDVQSYVKTVLSDLIFAAKVENELTVFAELTIAELRADFWIVAFDGYPVGAVEVKKPGEVNEVAWDINYGQLYDYLLRIRSFHGIRNVIGLFTNWNEWIFGWLEDSDASASATDLQYELGNNPTFSSPTTERKLHVSRKYGRADVKCLATALFSWLKKLVRNARSVAPVPLLHADRSYIMMTANQWVWERGIPVTELSFKPPRKNSQTFYLLRDFHGGADGRVWLACHIENSATGGRKGRLAVLKFQTRVVEGRGGNEALKAQAEVSRWHKLGVTSVYSTLLSGRHAIVMPFGFHYNRERTIDSKWWSPPENDPPIKDFNHVFTMVSNCIPDHVLDACIDKCAAKKLVHSDIEWRHVAIFPKKTRQLLTSTWTLGYCFIDLSIMDELKSSKAAKEQMEISKIRLLESI